MTIKLENIVNIKDILNCIFDPISIVDKNGRLLWSNEACEANPGGIPVSEMIGKHMNELIEMGVMDSSISLECIENNIKHGFGRITKDRFEERLNWVCPHLDENGEIEYVVNTEWNLNKLIEMQEYYTYFRSLNKIQQRDLSYFSSDIEHSQKIIYKSNKIKNILAQINRIALTDSSVLIQGESGTGKELFMKHIFSMSSRAEAPLIDINCGAIPESLIESELFGYEKGAFTGAVSSGKPGLFELANKGTLFLDEIGELSYNMQSKLLRAIQEKKIYRVGGTVPIPVDTRIIAATNVDLEEAVKEKKFRSDLYYRLNVVSIELPPLRERKEDIDELWHYFSQKFEKKYNKKITFSYSSIKLLHEYSWPGNIRELQNLIERIYIIEPHGEVSLATLASYLFKDLHVSHEDYHLSKQDLPGGIFNLTEAVEVYEKNLLEQNMDGFSTIREYADFLGISKSTLDRKLKKYKIKMEP